MEILYFINGKGLPAAIIVTNEAGENPYEREMVATYEIELADEVYATGYMRSRQEIEQWRPSSREALERFEIGLVNYFPGLSSRFWTGFVDQMAQEIKNRLRLREEWLAKQRERQQVKEDQEKEQYKANLNKDLA